MAELKLHQTTTLAAAWRAQKKQVDDAHRDVMHELFKCKTLKAATRLDPLKHVQNIGLLIHNVSRLTNEVEALTAISNLIETKKRRA